MKNKLLSIIILLYVTAFGYGDYAISWSTIDGGGGESSGGPYVLMGTIGQPDAGAMSGGCCRFPNRILAYVRTSGRSTGTAQRLFRFDWPAPLSRV